MSASQIAEITAREKLVHIEKLSGHKTVMIFLPWAAGGNRAHTWLLAVPLKLARTAWGYPCFVLGFSKILKFMSPIFHPDLQFRYFQPK